MSEQQIIDLLRLAIELAGDGGPQAFTDEEYTIMYDYLAQLERNIKTQKL